MTETVAVLIVTHNSRRHFGRLKSALDAQLNRDFFILVLDNASDQDQKPMPSDLPSGTRIIYSSINLGFAAGNNFLAREAPDADHLVLLNPDAFPDPEWLKALLNATQAWPNVAAFGSTQIADEDEARLDGLGDCYHVVGLPWRGGFGWPATTAPLSGEPFAACAAAMLIRRAAWTEVGGFDERFFCYGEDIDLSFRLRLRGWRIYQVGDARVRHIGSASSGRYSSFAVYHGVRNRIWTFVKNMPGWSFWVMAPAHLAMNLSFLFASFFRGTGRATLRGVLDGMTGLATTWRDRRRIQAHRTASTISILSAMTWNPLVAARRAPVLRVLRKR